MENQKEALRNLIASTDAYIVLIENMIKSDNNFTNTTLEPTRFRDFKTELKIDLIFTKDRLEASLGSYINALEQLKD